MSESDHLSDAIVRIRAMDRTGLAQAFTAANGSAVLAELTRLHDAGDEVARAATELARWSKVAIENGDLHARLASALAEWELLSRAANSQESSS